MSEVTSAVRVRPLRPQRAAAAVERARLSIVPNRPSTAPRAPFAILVFLVLAGGVVGLLMFNTQMQQASFHATELQAKADRLEAQSEALARQLDSKTDPQSVAAAARKQGLVEPPIPAVVDLEKGTVLGIPTAAGADDRTPLVDRKKPLPAGLNQKPLVKEVFVPPVNPDAPVAGNQAGTTPPANGPASTGNTPPTGTTNP